ncbi:MAG: ABC transporter permease [Chloroflexi bacterium]|nr:ABC transporter permease [Chloroflexota bacterium]
MSSYVITTQNITNSRRIRRFLSLLFTLASRDIRSRYRRSVLGPIWSILQPLILMVVFTLLRSLTGLREGGVTTDLMLTYTVLVPWQFFSNSINRAGPSVIGNGSIMRKIRVPREMFPVVGVMTAGFDFAMSALVLTGMVIALGEPVNLLALLWLPVLMIMLTLLALGVGMIIASFGVYRRDFILASGFFTQIWLYASPIIYTLEEAQGQLSETWQTVYLLNPTVGILEGFRSVLADGTAPDLDLLATSVPATLIFFLLGWGIYRYMSQYFADVL